MNRHDLNDIDEALRELRNAAQRLRRCGCPRAAAKARRALKSAEGARRNAESKMVRAQMHREALA